MVRKTASALWLILLMGVLSCATVTEFRPRRADFDRGLALFNHGEFKEATSYFLRATEDDPNFAQGYLYLGRSYLSMRRWREALQPLRTAYRLAPEETKEQVFELMMDAFLGAALGGNGAQAPGSTPDLFKNSP